MNKPWLFSILKIHPTKFLSVKNLVTKIGCWNLHTSNESKPLIAITSPHIQTCLIRWAYVPCRYYTRGKGAASVAAFAGSRERQFRLTEPYLSALSDVSVQFKTLPFVLFDDCLCYRKSCLIHVTTYTFTEVLRGDGAQHKSYSSKPLSSSWD